MALSSGYGHTCALRPDGTPVCWGWEVASHGHNPRAPSEPFVALTSSSSHTCALRADGSPVCWGQNEVGKTSPPPGETFALPSSS